MGRLHFLVREWWGIGYIWVAIHVFAECIENTFSDAN